MTGLPELPELEFLLATLDNSISFYKDDGEFVIQQSDVIVASYDRDRIVRFAQELLLIHECLTPSESLTEEEEDDNEEENEPRLSLYESEDHGEVVVDFKEGTVFEGLRIFEDVECLSVEFTGSNAERVTFQCKDGFTYKLYAVDEDEVVIPISIYGNFLPRLYPGWVKPYLYSETDSDISVSFKDRGAAYPDKQLYCIWEKASSDSIIRFRVTKEKTPEDLDNDIELDIDI